MQTEIEIKNRLLHPELETVLKENMGHRLLVSLMALNILEFDKAYTRNIKVEGKGAMSYVPAGKESEGKWDGKLRQSSTYGKVIRKILKENECLDEFNNGDIESAVNIIKAEFDIEANFEVIEGEDIRKYYHYSSYAPNVPLLAKSCMRHDKCQYFLDIYVDNAKLLILREPNNKDLILGRALLWKIGKVTYVDRIYGADSTQSKFIRYTHSLGYHTKLKQTYDKSRDWVAPDGKAYKKTLKIKLKKTADFYPYMDTFYFMDDNISKVTTISNASLGNSDLTLRQYEKGNNSDLFNKTFKKTPNGGEHHISALQMVQDLHRSSYYLKTEVIKCDMDKEFHFIGDTVVPVGHDKPVYIGNNVKPITPIDSGNFAFTYQVVYCAMSGNKSVMSDMTYIDGIGHVSKGKINAAKKHLEYVKEQK